MRTAALNSVNTIVTLKGHPWALAYLLKKVVDAFMKEQSLVHYSVSSAALTLSTKGVLRCY